MSRSHPRTLWHRALRRVDRRAEAIRANRPMLAVRAANPEHCPECAAREQLLREAALLANRLAWVAGIIAATAR